MHAQVRGKYTYTLASYHMHPSDTCVGRKWAAVLNFEELIHEPTYTLLYTPAVTFRASTYVGGNTTFHLHPGCTESGRTL